MKKEQDGHLPPAPDESIEDESHALRRAAIAGLVGAIPIVGGGFVELINLWLMPPIEQRRDEWFKSVGTAINALKDKVSAVEASLTNPSPEFVSVFVVATRAAMATHEKEKLTALRSAVLNTACSPTSDSMVLIHLLESLTESHVICLRQWSEKPISKVEVIEGESKWQKATGPYSSAVVLADLVARGLVIEQTLVQDLGGIGPDDLGSMTYSYKVTEAGYRFLNFIRAPSAP